MIKLYRYREYIACFTLGLGSGLAIMDKGLYLIGIGFLFVVISQVASILECD